MCVECYLLNIAMCDECYLWNIAMFGGCHLMCGGNIRLVLSTEDNNMCSVIY